MQVLCPFCTQLGLEETGLLGTELEANTILKPYSQSEDCAAGSPLKVPAFNLHGKDAGPLEGKDVFSALQI